MCIGGGVRGTSGRGAEGRGPSTVGPDTVTLVSATRATGSTRHRPPWSTHRERTSATRRLPDSHSRRVRSHSPMPTLRPEAGEGDAREGVNPQNQRSRRPSDTDPPHVRHPCGCRPGSHGNTCSGTPTSLLPSSLPTVDRHDDPGDYSLFPCRSRFPQTHPLVIRTHRDR